MWRRVEDGTEASGAEAAAEVPREVVRGDGTKASADKADAISTAAANDGHFIVAVC